MDRVDYQPLIVQDLVNWTQQSELDLEPWYQRRSVWTPSQKAFLLNTILEQKPVPTLYFRHIVDLELDRSMREVVDGQQRIRSILEYISDGFAAWHPEHARKAKYSKLSSTQKRALRETKLSGGWLLGASDSDVIEIFGRLNSVAKTLNAAELRNAKYSGEFKQFCLRNAAARVAIWRDLSIFTPNSIARMQEIEFTADLVLNLIRGLSDFSAAKLDAIYQEFEDEFPHAPDVERRVEKLFAAIADLPPTAISETIFSRPPIFFSLLLALDDIKAKVSRKALYAAIREIERRYSTDTPVSDRPQADAAFYEACRASTQRIKNRKIRHNYIRSFLK